jgi:hypothetical protein
MSSNSTSHLVEYINVKLAVLGCRPVPTPGAGGFSTLLSPLISQFRQQQRLLANHLCPADQRIQSFLYDYFQEAVVPKLPTRTLVLDRLGMARLLSLPLDQDQFVSDIISSYRVKQGVLHNPRSDRRTTEGIFHITEGGLPIPHDKKALPKAVFLQLLTHAFSPPRPLLRLPFTSTQPEPAECFVSLLLRPMVCPAVPGFTSRKTMEIRFFAPGNLVSNLDFVETIFGNGGDPGLPENDAGLDVEHWTGHTGCVILAPHLTQLTKQAVGLPPWEQATERQRRDGMCWRNAQELYNDGQAFKVTCRDETGVIVTVIADNYFGYCKKEVKTQLSFAANLYGIAEEEHAGGAMVFPSYDLGESFSGHTHVRSQGHTYAEMIYLFADAMTPMPEGFAVDKKHADILYVPEDANFDLHQQRISWSTGSGVQAIKLLPGKTYVRPSGYRVHVEKPAENRNWRLVGTVAEGILCHKPCTVSGGGKSEISKRITDAILTGPVFVADFKTDFDLVVELIGRDYSDRFRDSSRVDRREILSSERSLGSVIKLLTPDERDYKPEYNAWLQTIPQYLKELVFVVKRYYQPEWGPHWRDHFSVDILNGTPANELKFNNRKILTTYLRVGFASDGSWRTFGLRKDFYPAFKLQAEDDITASVVVPPGRIKGLPDHDPQVSLKFVENAEQRLFQRPDEAIHRGFDRQTEYDFSQPDNFFSNYEPLPAVVARELVEEAIGFDQFTPWLQEVIREVAETGNARFFVSTSHPRVIDGKPSKNPRYLQLRPDLVNPRGKHLAEMTARLRRRLPLSEPLHTPVTAVLPGRRNNPPEPRIRSLAVYNPIHYLPLPELFMEFISSLTGKSPSTTGAGSEGALTKGPFNALSPVHDLNNALVSWILTGHHGFVTAAGYVGPRMRVDHDISLLVPEVWCRMLPRERAPAFLIAEHFLEPCRDFEHQGRTVLASRLGYRITSRFVSAFFGRIFNHPHAVFTDEMLRPELQDLAVFADGMDNILTTQREVALRYFADESVEKACPPLQALLHIMAHGSWEGKGLNDPALRALFTRESLVASDWYQARLNAKQGIDRRLWTRHVGYLDRFLKVPSLADEAARLGIAARLTRARNALALTEAPDYLASLLGTIGAEPIQPGVHPAKAGQGG